MTDEEEMIVDELERNLLDDLRNFQPEEQYQGELGEWFNFTTNEEGENLKIEGNYLCVNISIEMTVYSED